MAKVERRGFPGLPCLKCGATDAVRVSVADTRTLSCGECNEDFTVDEARAILESWASVLTWIEAAPVIEKGSAR
jgi:hypothetical protein